MGTYTNRMYNDGNDIDVYYDFGIMTQWHGGFTGWFCSGLGLGADIGGNGDISNDEMTTFFQY